MITILNQHYTLKELWKLKSLLLAPLLSARRIINMFFVLYSYFTQSSSVYGAPPILMVEVTTKCNLQCIMCPRQLVVQKRKEGNMDFNTFKKIIDDTEKWLFCLALWNFSEPMLNENIYEFIEYAKQKKIFVSLATNGLLLSDSNIEKIIDSKLDYLIISIDGATKYVYETNRLGANFESVILNLSRLIKVRNAKKSKRPFVDLQFVVMRNNEHEIPEMLTLGSEIGVDKVSFKRLSNIQGMLNDLLPQGEIYKANNGGIIESNKICSRLYFNTVVSWDGAMFPCCHDIEFKHVLGNIFEEKGIMNIWNSNRYAEFRKGVKSSRMCNNCKGRSFQCDYY